MPHHHAPFVHLLKCAKVVCLQDVFSFLIQYAKDSVQVVGGWGKEGESPLHEGDVLLCEPIKRLTSDGTGLAFYVKGRPSMSSPKMTNLEREKNQCR